ncbi:hypothetical protein B0T16DRAFT_492756 [Cercophora newfieldiana]|uniref:4'-phosphopantetheinyl transferase domain-containing protein n=1 Tax=Cercophora newfieldiana TaxID=92897 RepID=A0AA39Y5X3_9PEZI|nr:hypothetical protein B0T16DRAFT_492756 [Cercophora newfieldiana]
MFRTRPLKRVLDRLFKPLHKSQRSAVKRAAALAKKESQTPPVRRRAEGQSDSQFESESSKKEGLEQHGAKERNPISERFTKIPKGYNAAEEKEVLSRIRSKTNHTGIRPPDPFPFPHVKDSGNRRLDRTSQPPETPTAAEHQPPDAAEIHQTVTSALASRAVTPFPFPNLQLGTDIVRISRIQTLLDGDFGQKFLKRILTEGEALDIWKAKPENNGSMTPDDWTAFTHEMKTRAGTVAGRFAVKEAVIKAHWGVNGGRGVTFHDVVVVKERGVGAGTGPPRAFVRGEGGRWREVRVSISHDGEYATAVCMGVVGEGGV